MMTASEGVRWDRWLNLSIPVLAAGLTTAALYLAVFVGGPLLRALVGAPAGFGEHFVSNRGYTQALLVQSAVLAAAFVVLGIALGRYSGPVRFRSALLAANPVTVGVGFIVFKITYAAMPLDDHWLEYFNIRDGVFLALLAPLVFAGCVAGAASLSSRRSRSV